MRNFIKGIFVGIFNIIPGLSGSALLIVLGLYDKCTHVIANFFKNPKKSFLFLFPIGSGIVLGTYIFSNIIFFLLNNWSMEINIVFAFFLIGTIPQLFKEATKNGFNKKYLILFFITFIIGTSMLFIDNKSFSYNFDYNLVNFFKFFAIGCVISFASVIPGISSTVLLSILNLYGIYIYSVSTLNLIILFPVLIGFVITTFLISKTIDYLLEKYYGYTYFAILGFSISTIPCMLKMPIVFNINFFISIIIGFFAFALTYFSFKVIK